MNLGALTVKVGPCGARDGRPSRRPPGPPGRVLKELLGAAEFAGADYFGVSGHQGHFSEVAATQRALRELAGGFDAVVYSAENLSWSIC